MRNIRQNLFLAFIYNAVGVPVAAGLLYPVVGLLISPMWASAAMTMSSLSVIGKRAASAPRRVVVSGEPPEHSAHQRGGRTSTLTGVGRRKLPMNIETMPTRSAPSIAQPTTGPQTRHHPGAKENANPLTTR